MVSSLVHKVQSLLTFVPLTLERHFQVREYRLPSSLAWISEVNLRTHGSTRYSGIAATGVDKESNN